MCNLTNTLCNYNYLVQVKTNTKNDIEIAQKSYDK